jgi:hypothetical protein
MAAPPVPPRPFDYPDHPPPVPPVPPDLREQETRRNTPSPYELPHFSPPLPAPRPHRFDPSIPANVSLFPLINTPFFPS